jgi:hypothetical protein
VVVSDGPVAALNVRLSLLFDRMNKRERIWRLSIQRLKEPPSKEKLLRQIFPFSFRGH